MTALWLHHTDDTYSAEISELRALETIRCPICDRELDVALGWQVHKNSDGDIGWWTKRHDCGASLQIFND